MHPSIRQITLVISLAAVISGCNTLGVLARTEQGAAREAGTVFDK